MNNEISDLLTDAVDRGLDAEQEARLAEILAHDPDASAQFRQFMQLHLELAEKSAPVRAFSAAELRAIRDVEARFSSAAPKTTCEARLRQLSATTRSTSAGSSRPWKWLTAALAASLLLSLVLLRNRDALEISQRQSTNDRPAKEHALPANAKVVAEIIKKVECVWQNDQWRVNSRAELVANERISIDSGLLVMQFESGATVALRGPASAMPNSVNSMTLVEGELTARVPESAKNFTVITQSGEIVDLGTEFAVSASRSGVVETHVFEGEVIARGTRPESEPPNSIEVSIKAGAARVLTPQGISDASTAHPERFIRLEFGKDKPVLSPPPSSKALRLWLSSAGRMQLDEDQSVAAWGDNIIGTNQFLHDAWQIDQKHRPKWLPDAMNGRPALEFDGMAGLVTEPLHLGSSTTSVVVFKLDRSGVPAAFERIRSRIDAGLAQSRPDLGIQLLNLNGPPHSVLQINEDFSLRARVHLGWAKDNDIGVTQSPTLADEAHIAVYSFDTEEGMARLFIDGQLVSEIGGVPQQSATKTPRYIGSHYDRRAHGFTGLISEVLLYSRALAPDEAFALTVWLADKYGLPVAIENLEAETLTPRLALQ